MPLAASLGQFRDLMFGLEKEVPLLDGRRRPYVNLDNAATTPPFRAVVDCVNETLPWYSSVHRGTGYKSLLSSRLYEQCRDEAMRFVNADPSYHTAVFCSNTTDAINRLCHCMSCSTDDVVLTTVMEHHSNLLPWRFHAKVEYAEIDPSSGSLDMSDMEDKLRRHGGNVRLVAVTGASNVTGALPPLREIAVLAHAHGARLLVDGAQLVAHRAVDMGRAGDPERIDFLAFSGHKMYAPFGSGALIGPRECFDASTPYPMGGGAVELVTLNEVEWADSPERLEAGSPNVIGAVALAKAAKILQSIGMAEVARHEQEMREAALEMLRRVPQIVVYGDVSPDRRIDRVGVIPIVSPEIHHSLLAAILGYEYGIGARHGCFCAHPYTGKLLGLKDEEMRDYMRRVRCGDRGNLPGFVRISLGIYNTLEELEYLAWALREIHAGKAQGDYRLDRETGQYTPANYAPDFDVSISF